MHSRGIAARGNGSEQFGYTQICLLSSTLFNIFSNGSCLCAREEQYGKANTDSRAVSNLRFVDDVDALAEEEQELEALVKSLD